MPYKDKEKQLMNSKKWNREHKEKINKQHKEYRENNGEKIKKHNKKMLNEFKLMCDNLKINGCAICPSHKNLDFHHSYPPDKKFIITQGCGRSNKVLSDELNKCILLCRSCHMKIEYKERTGGI